jgi:hypothetical protein
LFKKYLPVWHKTTKEVVLPFIENVWNKTVEYTNIGLVKCEPYILIANDYLNQAKIYVT